MDLTYYFQLIWRKKWLIISVPMLVMLVMFIIFSNMPRYFKARAILSTGITEEYDGINQGFVQPFTINQKFVNLQEQIRSQPVLTAVGYELLLHDLDNPNQAFRVPRFDSDGPVVLDAATIKSLLRKKLTSEYLFAASELQEDELSKILEAYGYDYNSIAKNMVTQRLPESDFLKVEYSAEHPGLAAFTVNKACEMLVAMRKQSALSVNDNMLEYFRKLALQKKNELDGLIEDLKNFKLRNGVINLYEQTKALVDHIKDVEILREQEKKNIRGLKRNVNDIEDRLTPRRRMYLESLAGDFNKRMEATKAQMASLRSRYIDGGMKDPNLADSLAYLQKQFDELVATNAETFLLNPNNSKQTLVNRKLNSELDLEVAENAAGSLDNESRRLTAKIAEFTPLEAVISAREREISAAQEAYLVILNKLNSAQFGAGNFYDGMKLLEKALTPEKPESNRMWVYIILAGLVTFFIMILLVWTAEYMDVSVRSVTGFERETGIKPVGGLNLIPKGNFDLEQVFQEDTETPALELFKKQIRSLRNTIETDKESKVYLLTDFSGQQGKTTLAVSLAYALGLTGKRVLLADANFRNNELTRIFNAAPTINQGMNNMVLPDNARSVTQRIDVAGTGVSSMTPSEIMPDYAWRSLFDRWKREYDYILVETRSMSTSDDINELIPYCDKLIALFDSHSVVTKAELSKLSMLQNHGAKFGGIVLNRIKKEFMGDIVSEKSFEDPNSGWFEKMITKKDREVAIAPNANGEVPRKSFRSSLNSMLSFLG